MKRIMLALMLAGSACVVRYREPVYEYSAVAPPAPQVEVVGVAPSANHFWIGGHYYWSGGRYLWRPGYWEVRRPHEVWVGGRWDHHPNRGHYYIEGHWERRG